MPSALDDRTFETAESVASQLTAEDLENSRQHFADKGYEVEVEGDNAAPAAAEPEAQPEPAQPEAQPVEAPPAAAVVDQAIDEETRREYQETQAQPDGEKLSRTARKNKLIREQAQGLSERDGQIAELRRQLAEKGTSPSTQPTPVAASPFAQPSAPAAASPEPPAAKKFEKPEPKLPVFEDFVNEDDPLKAHADAVAKYVDQKLEYQSDKQAFESQQRQSQEQQSFADRKAQEVRSTKLAAAQQAHPDFMDVIKPGGRDVEYGEVLQYLLRDELEDGFDLGYQLARPENADFFNRLRNEVAVTKGEDPQSVGRKITRASGELAVFRHELKKKAEVPPAPAPPAAPAAQPPAAPVARTQQTPPVAVPPRREEAAPTPIRGNGAPAQRIEDIDPMDSDARRAFKKAQGIM